MRTVIGSDIVFARTNIKKIIIPCQYCGEPCERMARSTATCFECKEKRVSRANRKTTKK